MSTHPKSDQKSGQKRALGQGLSALLGPDINETISAPNTHTAPNTHMTNTPAHVVDDVNDDISDDTSDITDIRPNQTRMLAVHTITAGKFQPRQNFDQQELEALAQSIREHGVLQPILVRPRVQTGQESTQEVGYELIAGERRWRASKLAGLKEVPAIIKTDISDRQALEIGILENIQRNDLTIMEEARGYQRLMEEFDYTQEMLSQTLGKSRSHVANMVRLLGLEPKAQEHLDAKKITFGHARALISLYDEPLDYVLDQIEKKNLTVRQTERLVRKVHTYGYKDPSNKSFSTSQHVSGQNGSFADASGQDSVMPNSREYVPYPPLGEDLESVGAVRNMEKFIHKAIGGDVKIILKEKEVSLNINFEDIGGIDYLLEILDQVVNGFTGDDD